MVQLTKLPGIIDAHVHLRDPGAIQKEDLYTGTCAALAGGIVALIDMPNNSFPTTSLRTLRRKERLAAKKCVCDYGFYFGASNKNWDVDQVASNKTFGLKIYMDHTTGPLLIEDLKVLENHFRFWPKEKPILVHAEDSTLAKAIGLTLIYKKWLHICHVSQASEIELIKRAKKAGGTITCEVAPHHLFLTKEDGKKLGPFVKMRPPLRTKKDQQTLWWAINNDLIDYIATDHAPHTLKEKKSDNSPYGVPGLETMLPLLLTAVTQKRLSLKKLIELTSLKPSKLLKIKLKDCWVEVDLNKSWLIRNKNLKTKCGWSPFDGWKVKGKVIKVFIRGKKVFENGKVLVKGGFGRLL
ncbi:amidohydrolase family protein [Candidatus Microgenomates bacterium]|nr:amidohydrolase family protein [Candidatus Microgenomates bacterium]